MPSGFFEPTGDADRFIATDHCAGSWSSTLLHGGPPSGLLVRTIEQLPTSIDRPVQISRVSVDILGPVPVGEVQVTARVSRPGRNVEQVEAQLAAGGRVAMIARAWRMRVVDLELPVPAGPVPVPATMPGFPQSPIELPAMPPDATGTYRLAMWNTGYADAVDWRFVSGSEEGNAPAVVWARPRLALVAGEAPTPLSLLMLLADTGNGLSRMLDVDAWWFINPELTVHLHRQPAGEWFLLAARSIVETTGTGLTETELFDQAGRVGRAAQSLMVGPR